MMPAVALFTGSVRLLLQGRRTIALAALQLAPAILFLLGSSGRTEDAALRTFVDITLGAYFALVLPIVAIVIASAALGAERRDQTLSVIVLRPIPRSAIATTKVLASWAVSAVLGAIGVVALALALAAGPGFDATIVIGLATGMVISTGAYSALIVPLGFITDRAVIFALAYLLVFENGVVTALPGLSVLSPSRLGIRTLGLVAEDLRITIDSSLNTMSFDAAPIITTTIVYLVLGALLSSLLLKRRDLA